VTIIKPAQEHEYNTKTAQNTQKRILEQKGNKTKTGHITTTTTTTKQQ
jgi:hypothetical protein